MKKTTRLGTVTLMLYFGVAVIHAQPNPINMTFSGSAGASGINLGGSPAAEYRLAGNGALGQGELRVLSVGTSTPQLSSTCSGPTKGYFPVAVGEAVFRSDDGALLTLNLTGGSDCVDFSGAQPAICIRVFEITGGTGRFQNAAASGGVLTLTMAVWPVVPHHLGFFAVTAQVTGAIPGVATGEGPQDGQR